MRLGSLLSLVMGVSVLGAVVVGAGILLFVGTSPTPGTNQYLAGGIGVVLLGQALVSLYLLTQSDPGF
jgi:hypothetical protein